MKIRLNELIYDMTSAQYHGCRNSYSSSQFKDALEDEELFHKKYVTREIPREEADAFDVGNYFHTGTLEPDKLSGDCIAYPGKIRRGKDWESFKKKHKDKTIVTMSQLEQAKRLITCVRASPVAMGYIGRGKPEVSTFVELAIYAGEIYVPKYRLTLGRNGWEKHSGKIHPKAVRLVVKVRADCLGDEFILDLKSTTGNAKSEKTMRDKISYYNYDLSASLYCDIFAVVCDRTFDFIWTFASKDYFNSRSYKASKNNILVGRAKWRKAILKIANGISTKWVFPDYLAVLEPNHYELEHIAPTDADLV